jgi:putative tricarboxylic transport membrane protein
VTAPAEDQEETRAAGLLGLLMVVVAVVVLVDAARLRGADAAVGPAAVPTLVGVLLGLTGGILAFRARRLLRTGQSNGRRWRLAALVAALVAFAFLLPVTGWVVSASGLFVAASLLLGAPHPARVVAYGWTLAVVAYVVFDVLIGLTLPTGPWGF